MDALLERKQNLEQQHAEVMAELENLAQGAGENRDPRGVTKAAEPTERGSDPDDQAPVSNKQASRSGGSLQSGSQPNALGNIDGESQSLKISWAG